jgi:hypothetical protein
MFVRINELESIDGPMRFHFEDKLKIYAAAPPDVLSMERKGLDPVMVPNVFAVIATTNHLERALALSREDQRTMLCWSPITREMLPPDYNKVLGEWMAHGGSECVMQYLLNLDVSDFDPRAMAPMTRAKGDVQAVSEDPLGVSLQDLVDIMGRPMALTLADLDHASNQHQVSFDGLAISSLKYRSRLPSWLRDAGYSRIANPAVSTGHFLVKGRRIIFYARNDARDDALAFIKMRIDLGF